MHQRPAAGSLIFRKAARGEAFMERARSRTSGSIDFNPMTVETTIGKKPSRKATMTLGSVPKPNQTTKSGATATLGTLCEKTRIG